MSGRERPRIQSIEAFSAGVASDRKQLAIHYIYDHVRAVAGTLGVSAGLSSALSAFVTLGLDRGVPLQELRDVLQLCSESLDEAAVKLAEAKARLAVKQ